MKRIIPLFLLLTLFCSPASSPLAGQEISSQQALIVAGSDTPDQVVERPLHWLFGGIVILWILMMLTFIGIMIARFTLRSWPPENPNPYKDETMGMPPGVLRSILTLSLVVFIFLIELYRFQHPNDLEEFSRELISGFEIMLGFYFGTKALQTLSNNDTRSQQAAAAAVTKKASQANPLHDPSSEG